MDKISGFALRKLVQSGQGNDVTVLTNPVFKEESRRQ